MVARTDPSPVVVDASVVAAILLDEPRADEAEQRLEGRVPIAPDLLPMEIANVVVRAARQHGDASTHVALLRALEDLEIQLTSVDAGLVVSTALRTGLSAYDASYLVLARLLDIDLVTFDARLAEAYEAE